MLVDIQILSTSFKWTEACNLKQVIKKFSGKYYKGTWNILGPRKTK